uniref:Translation initiation factor IF-2, chloroplastic n=1 Tax=Chondria sp. (in: red algae) TaxID=1982705 RepID=A0A1Z1MD72_9FLOR|nr:translation initiation factor 2 [Chondria sp. (in: red algae)]
MIYIFSEKLLSLKTKLNYILIDSFECSESTLELRSPKLIDDLHLITVKSMNNVLKNSFDNNVDNLHKLDKKYQQKSYSVDEINVKKIKNKTIKKKRVTSPVITTKSLLIDNQEDLLNQTSLNVPELRVRKLNNKNKKKNKGKINNLNIVNNEISDTNINKGQTLSNDSIGKTVIIPHSITVHDLSYVLKIPEAEIITYLFLNKSIAATVNHFLDIHIIKEVAEHYNFTVVSDKENIKTTNESNRKVTSSDGHIRSPIITILGHVDHGKTTLLDTILETNLVHNEFGGITQSMSAYEMSWTYQSHNYDLIFLDTPGHESFKAIRLRGAKITDIALLIISVDDGLKPQTVEAINYIKQFNIACIVVITKVDKSDQNIEFILNDLSTHGIVTEEWGGSIPLVQVSAIYNRNIDTLLSKICMLSSVKNFTANIDQLAVGTIIDSYLDKKQGPVASILVRDGILKVGNVIASGNIYGKVKRVISLSSEPVSVASPSSIVQVLGFSIVPMAGLDFKVFYNEKQAKEFCLNAPDISNNTSFSKTLSSRIVQNYGQNLQNIKLIIKADTQGSLEAIIDLLSTISQQKVQLSIISASFTTVSNSDFDLASTTGASIIAFNVDLTSDINNSIKKYNIIFKNFNVIYDLFEFVKTSMLNLVEPEYDRVFIGRAIVKTIFNINKGCVAGCYVSEGKLIKSSYLCVYRKQQLIYEGLLNSLKRLKNDVNEVSLGNECGVMCDYDLWKEDDSISAYQLIPKQKIL